MSARASNDVLGALVHQFSDPFACLREMVQNALDAGSREIDVDVRFDPGAGRLVLDVQDYGEGMDAQIIDTRLTRLFSSAKDGDLTKIGRFGIGFVSVFALEPELVCVDTGRGGEYWRVLFQPDRTFERLALEEPVEGTRVRVYKPATEESFESFRLRVTDVVTRWCRFARATVRVLGKRINRNFHEAGPCALSHRDEDGHIVVAYTTDRKPTAGFYHRGLTLLERETFIDHVDVRIESPHLEHTLTRDQLVQNDKLHELLERAEDLSAGLVDRLHTLLTEQPEQAPHWLAWAAQSCQEVGRVPPAWLSLPLVKLVSDERWTLRQLQSALHDRSVWLVNEPSPLTERMEGDGCALVVCEGAEAQVAQLCKLLAPGRSVHELGEHHGITLPLDERRAENLVPLVDALRALFEAAGCPPASVTARSMEYPGSSVRWEAMLAVQDPEGIATLPDAVPGADRSYPPLHWQLNGRKRDVQRLSKLAERQPGLAAYLVLKLAAVRSWTGEHDQLWLAHARRVPCP